ncbi:LOW QUALITY PROTEIN: protein CBFA2T3-like [Guaruba guarouba]
MNGSSHSPNAMNKALSTPSRFSNGPATSSTTSLPTHQLPLACSAHQLSKLKRFLIMLQQFSNDISPKIGEQVHTLILGLVNSTLTIDEFHTKLQEATNFPLRPFVPFLKANLLLQQELLHCTCVAKQIPAQYLAQHEQLLLDANISPINSSELLLEVGESSKRRTPDKVQARGMHGHYSPSNGLIRPPNGLGHPPAPPPPPPPQHYRLESAYCRPDPQELHEHQHPTIDSAQEEVIYHQLTDWEWAEEWKHLNNLLNCFMDMVEKKRQSLTVLRRCQEADREELNPWIRHYSNAEDMKKGSALSAQPHNSSSTSEAPQLDTHREFTSRPLSGYMPEEIWRKCGAGSSVHQEAMNEVKRQAMSELQKAVSYAEQKAHKLITMERAKMERALAKAKCQASEDALTVINQQDWSEVGAVRGELGGDRIDGSMGIWDLLLLQLSFAASLHASMDTRGTVATPWDAWSVTGMRGPGCRCTDQDDVHSLECRCMVQDDVYGPRWGCVVQDGDAQARMMCMHKDWEKHHRVCRQNLQGLPVPAAPTVGARLPPGPGQPDGVATITSSPRETGSVAASYGTISVRLRDLLRMGFLWAPPRFLRRTPPTHSDHRRGRQGPSSGERPEMDEAYMSYEIEPIVEFCCPIHCDIVCE